MKIAIITSLYGLNGGGAGLVVEHLAQGLTARGHTIVVITTGTVPGVQVEELNGIKFYRFLPLNLYPLQKKDEHSDFQKAIWQIIDIYNPHTAGVLRKILAAENPEVVNIHKMRGFSGAAWSASSTLCPGRVLYTCHDYESMSPVGTLEGKVGAWVLQRRWPFRLYQKIRSRFAYGIRLVTAPSAFTLDLVMQSGVFPGAAREVVPNFQPVSNQELEAIRERSKPSSGPLHLLYIGRLEIEKGLRELCGAFVKVAESHSHIKMTIAGWGGLEEELRNTYDSHPQIEFAGKVTGEVKERLLAQVDLLIIPSTWLENAPVVVIEAYTYGKPIIASSLGGLNELVLEGKTGWLVPAGDVNALASAILQAARSPENVRGMFTACFEQAPRFAMDKVLNEYERLYTTLIRPEALD